MVRLVGAHNQYIVWSGSEEENLAAMRHMMYRLGPDLMELLWELQLADVLAQHPAKLQGKLEMLAKSKQLHQRILEQGDCVSLKQLAVNGKDLIELGIQPGKQIGEVLERLLEQVLDNPVLNEKSVLLSQGKQFLT